MITPNARLTVVLDPAVPMIVITNKASQNTVSTTVKISLAFVLAHFLNRFTCAVMIW